MVYQTLGHTKARVKIHMTVNTSRSPYHSGPIQQSSVPGHVEKCSVDLVPWTHPELAIEEFENLYSIMVE